MAHEGCDVAQQLQHLSCFTALQQLSIRATAGPGKGWAAGDVAGIQHLSQLTVLVLESYDLEFTTSSTRSWACLTALQSLALLCCKVQPEALAALTQLQLLSLLYVGHAGHQSPDQGRAITAELLSAVSHLQLLSELGVVADISSLQGPPPDPAAVAAAVAACTSLASSTNLASLHLGLVTRDITQECVLFNAQARALFPRLLEVNLLYSDSMPLGEQQPGLLCSCCPAVDSLSFKVVSKPAASITPAAFLSLLQLAALTHLAVSVGSAAATAPVVDVAAQLTGLKQLRLQLLHLMSYLSPCDMSCDMLLQLTALTALEELKLQHYPTTFDEPDESGSGPVLHLQNQVRVDGAPLSARTAATS
jgi:hypothetical protein